jgi:hypothetical protein
MHRDRDGLRELLPRPLRRVGQLVETAEGRPKGRPTSCALSPARRFCPVRRVRVFAYRRVRGGVRGAGAVRLPMHGKGVECGSFACR